MVLDTKAAEEALESKGAEEVQVVGRPATVVRAVEVAAAVCDRLVRVSSAQCCGRSNRRSCNA